jgi:site-specific recombinase XerC
MREVAPGVWEVAVTSEGQRHYRRVRGSRDEAAAALAGLVAQTGGRADTLDALVAAYLAHLEDAGRSPATVHRYRQLWRDWLSPTLATRHPTNSGRPALERALAPMAKAGLSSSSIHQAAVFLSGCFAWARRNGTIDRNPALALRLPDGTILAPPRRR